MTHPDVDMLRDFVAGALAPAAEAEVREHLLSGCDQCHQAVHGEAALEHALWEVRRADEEQASAIVDQAAAGVAPVVPLKPRTQASRMSVYLGGAALAASAALAIFVVTGPDDEAAPPASATGLSAIAGAEPGASGAALPGQAALAQPAGAPTALEPAAEPPAPSADPAAATAIVPSPAAAPPPLPSAKPAASTPKKPATTRRTSAAKPKAEPPPPPSAPKKRRRDCDPILDADCDEQPRASNGGGAKATLSPSDVLSTVRKNLGGINRCGTKHGVQATVKMEWRILKSGRTSSVRVMTPKYADTPVGKCMIAEIKKWKFPAITGTPPPPVKFPFKLKG